MTLSLSLSLSRAHLLTLVIGSSASQDRAVGVGSRDEELVRGQLERVSKGPGFLVEAESVKRQFWKEGECVPLLVAL